MVWAVDNIGRCADLLHSCGVEEKGPIVVGLAIGALCFSILAALVALIVSMGIGAPAWIMRAHDSFRFMVIILVIILDRL